MRRAWNHDDAYFPGDYHHVLSHIIACINGVKSASDSTGDGIMFKLCSIEDRSQRKGAKIDMVALGEGVITVDDTKPYKEWFASKVVKSTLALFTLTH